MDLHQLKIFLAVYKKRSFSKASEEVNLTQPTVSDHIKTLEEEINCRLFDRLGRTILPTTEADKIYPLVVELIERAEQIRELISVSRSTLEGDLLIGASNIPGIYLLPSIIVSFKKIYKDINFSVKISDSQDIYEKILNQELFVGLVGALINDDSIKYEPFYDDKLVLVASTRFDFPDVVTSNSLKSLPIILRERGSGTRKETEEIFRKNRIDLNKINVVSTFGSTEAIKEAIKSGMGCSVLSQISVRDEIATGLFKEIPIKGVNMF
ncbi:MAG: selenium metabolism-associated LysR family transcriptional regulator, partial [Thermodesulfovibrionales bacterium]|nr:selenium metabolism-associated LysR family transcriptional regulator [Thermodesulfovibrionales bacterium]